MAAVFPVAGCSTPHLAQFRAAAVGELRLSGFGVTLSRPQKIRCKPHSLKHLCCKKSMIHGISSFFYFGKVRLYSLKLSFVTRSGEEGEYTFYFQSKQTKKLFRKTGSLQFSSKLGLSTPVRANCEHLIRSGLKCCDWKTTLAQICGSLTIQSNSSCLTDHYAGNRIISHFCDLEMMPGKKSNCRKRNLI